jgi:hypothetical protein
MNGVAEEVGVGLVVYFKTTHCISLLMEGLR